MRLIFSGRLGLVFRWVYLITGAHVLGVVGALSAGAGHAPLTMLKTMGSWYTLFWSCVYYLDIAFFNGDIWRSTLGSYGGIGLVIGNILVPMGFPFFYAFMRWWAKGWLRSDKPFVMFWITGGFIAFLLSVMQEGYPVLWKVLSGVIGLVVGTGYILLDGMLLRRLDDRQKVAPKGL